MCHLRVVVDQPRLKLDRFYFQPVSRLLAERDLIVAERDARFHRLKRRTRKLLVISQVDELCGSEEVFDWRRRLLCASEIDGRDGETICACGSRLTKARDVEVQRHHALFDRECAERMQQHVGARGW